MMQLQTEAAANLTEAVAALQDRLETRVTSLKDTISGVRTCANLREALVPRPSRAVCLFFWGVSSLNKTNTLTLG